MAPLSPWLRLCSRCIIAPRRSWLRKEWNAARGACARTERAKSRGSRSRCWSGWKTCNRCLRYSKWVVCADIALCLLAICQWTVCAWEKSQKRLMLLSARASESPSADIRVFFSYRVGWSSLVWWTAPIFVWAAVFSCTAVRAFSNILLWKRCSRIIMHEWKRRLVSPPSLPRLRLQYTSDILRFFYPEDAHRVDISKSGEVVWEATITNDFFQDDWLLRHLG